MQFKVELDLSLSYQSFRSPLAWNIRGWFISGLDTPSAVFQSHCPDKSGKRGTPFVTSLIFLPWQINRIHTELGRCPFKETRFQECKTVNNIKNDNSITVFIFLEATDASCCEWWYWNPYIREKKEYLEEYLEGFTLITPTNAPWISPLYLLTTSIPGWKYLPTIGSQSYGRRGIRYLRYVWGGMGGWERLGIRLKTTSMRKAFSRAPWNMGARL